MRGELWRAPVATSPVDAVVRIPGSKSVTNRALVIGAISTAPATLRRPLRSRDTTLMAAGLRALGVAIEDEGEDWHLVPAPLHGPASIDVGNAGTVMRFLPPLAAVAAGSIAFDGDPAARRRPVAALVEALRALGADIDDGSGRRDTTAMPFTVHGRGWLLGGDVTVDASESSQFVSALLLAGPRYANGVAVRHRGPTLPSRPHIDMTVEMLRRAGAVVETVTPDVWRVEPGPIALGDILIEPDLSNAAPFLAAAVVTSGTVTVPDWPRHTRQPGAALPQLLGALGATSTLTADGLVLSGTGSIAGIDVDLHDVPELTPILTALAALADSPSRFRGVAHLRLQESDRLAALAKEITALGGDVAETDDGLVVRPQPLHGGVFDTYDDHRLAMAAAVLGLRVAGIDIDNVATTGKTLPDFTGRWLAMLEAAPADTAAFAVPTRE